MIPHEIMRENRRQTHKVPSKYSVKLLLVSEGATGLRGEAAIAVVTGKEAAAGG